MTYKSIAPSLSVSAKYCEGCVPKQSQSEPAGPRQQQLSVNDIINGLSIGCWMNIMRKGERIRLHQHGYHSAFGSYRY